MIEDIQETSGIPEHTLKTLNIYKNLVVYSHLLQDVFGGRLAWPLLLLRANSRQQPNRQVP